MEKKKSAPRERDGSSKSISVSKNGARSSSVTRILKNPKSGAFVSVSETSKRVLKDSAATHRDALERLAKR